MDLRKAAEIRNHPVEHTAISLSLAKCKIYSCKLEKKMLEGWYCRTLANEQAAAAQSNHDDDENDPNIADSGSEESQDGVPANFNAEVNYKAQYIYLKQKLKFLLYENEFFQDALRSSQRRLLKVSRDRSFLLDRLLQYEKPDTSSSESDDTESSDEENSRADAKKRKLEPASSNGTVRTAGRKKKVIQQKSKQQPMLTSSAPQHSLGQEGHMTAEEVERHLQSRHSITELVPERAPPTVPTEMFSNEPSLDSESNDQMIETSPSNVGEDCLSVDMNLIKCEYNS